LTGELFVGDNDQRTGAFARESASARLRRIDAGVVFDLASELSRDRGSHRGVPEEPQSRHR
jgi:hypothetical protein